MMAQDRAPTREADAADQRPVRSPGAMSHQSDRGYEAAPQAFVRLTGSHLAKPRISRTIVTITE